MGSPPLLEMVNIHKRFPGVYALRGVSLTLYHGEVHALMGENGAGKSTLINVLGGIYPKDEGEIRGEIRIEGRETQLGSILAAREAGISIIHQELVLVPYLSVAENIFINREPMKNRMIDYQTMYSDAQRFVDELGLELDVRRKVMTLTIAQQQMVEIVRAVSFKAKIIVMDEPTSSLSDKEVQVLFDNIAVLKKRGIGIIYISHKLSELARIADRVTVLRDGEISGETMRITDTAEDQIVRMMVGREVPSYYVRTYNQPGPAVISASKLCSRKVRGVSFEVRAGEIVGFAGLVGAGRTETIRALLGFDEMTAGTVMLEGKPVNIHNPKEAYEMGIGYIPENRREEGIVPLQTLRFNITLKVLKKFIRGVFVDGAKERAIVDEYIQKLRIKTPSHSARLQNLSGGNQQKSVIASWLTTTPKLLIMDEPTRGIDVGAKAEIYAIMNSLVEMGMAILMISSELPELIGMSDRVVVMRQGTVSKVIERDAFSQEEIMRHAINI